MKSKDPRKRIVRGRTCWVVDYCDASGKRRRAFFDSKTEAQQKQDAVNAAPKARPLNVCVDPEVRLGTFMGEWLKDRILAPEGWKPGTVRAYRDVLQRVLAFRIGGTPGTITVGGIPYPADSLAALKVRDLDAGHLEALTKGMDAQGFAPGTMRLTITLLGAVCARAVRKKLLASNPLNSDLRKELAPYLTTTADEPKHFTKEQAQTFLLEARRSSRLFPLYVLGFANGLRIGELIAVWISDLQGAKLQVARQLDPTASCRAPVVIPPKRGKVRVVDVGADVLAVLNQIIRERPAQALKHGWGKTPWLFVTQSGTPHRRQCVRHDFHRVLRRCGLQDSGLTVHSLRHSWIHWHVEAGTDPTWVMQQAGHADIKVTMSIYAKNAKRQAPGAADALAAGLFGNTVGNKG